LHPSSLKDYSYPERPRELTRWRLGNLSYWG